MPRHGADAPRRTIEIDLRSIPNSQAFSRGDREFHNGIARIASQVRCLELAQLISQDFRRHARVVRLAFSPDGRHLAGFSLTHIELGTRPPLVPRFTQSAASKEQHDRSRKPRPLRKLRDKEVKRV